VHRIAVEIPIMIVAAAMMASVVLLAGTAIAPPDEEILTPARVYAVPLRDTDRSVLCTPSYCEPPTMLPEAPDRLMPPKP